MKKRTKPLPKWAVGLVQCSLWEAEELGVAMNFRRRGCIELAREHIGKLEQAVGNRTRETGSGEGSSGGVILNQAARERGVQGLSK